MDQLLLMEQLLLKALDLAEVKGAEYADMRLVNTMQERLVVRDGVADTLSRDQFVGLGVAALEGSMRLFAKDVMTALIEFRPAT